MKNIEILNIKKEIDESLYDNYVDKLYEKVCDIIKNEQPDCIHIQQLCFGMAKAFSKIKNISKIAICHGSDVLIAQKSLMQRTIIREVCDASD